MEYLLFCSVLGLVLGVSVSMITMAILYASLRDNLSEGPEPSLAGIGVDRNGESGAGLVDSPHGASATRAKDYA